MTDDRFGIVGKVVARTYQVRDVVAEGGFGVVYRAYHQGFRAEVALKCLKVPNELSDEQRRSFLEQFRSEAEVLFRLSTHHPHIVRPLHVDAFQTSSQKLVPFMALEWLEGKTLDGWIAERSAHGKPPLSLPRIVKLLTPVARALEHAHNLPGPDGPQTVVHRDMKPENLFLARIGGVDVPKILDFGISKVKSTAGQMVGKASLHADALIAFSPAYAAPEQWAPRSYGQTGPWTDVWGLALTVVEAAKGEEVVTGDQAEMMGTILNPGRRPTPRNEGVGVSDAVEAVFAQALALDPRRRYQSIGAFWDELIDALGLADQVAVVSAHSPIAKGQSTAFDSVPPRGAMDAAKTPLAVVPPLAVPQLSAPRLTRSPPSPQRLPQAQTQVGGRPSSLLAAGQNAPAEPWVPSISKSEALGGQRSYGAGQFSSREPAPKSSLGRSLAPALTLVALSVALTLLDRAMAHSRGVPLSLGPIRASWVAGALMVIALVSGISALKRVLDD